MNSPYADRVDKTGVYGFNVAAARRLLETHGWSISSEGSHCVRPGRRRSECGAGIAKGAKLAFHLSYYPGTAAVQLQDQLIAADGAKVGITITSTPLDSLFSNIVRCKAGTPACKWVLGEDGGWTPSAYPVDPALFGISSSADVMSYNSAANVRNMNAAMYVDSPKGERAYQNYLARELPLLWVPTPDMQVSAISTKLAHIGGQEPTLGITPENWVLSPGSGGASSS